MKFGLVSYNDPCMRWVDFFWGGESDGFSFLQPPGTNIEGNSTTIFRKIISWEGGRDRFCESQTLIASYKFCPQNFPTLCVAREIFFKLQKILHSSHQLSSWRKTLGICINLLGGSSQLVSKWLVTPLSPICKPFRPFKGGTTRSLGDLFTMVLNHLQVLGWSSKYATPFYFVPEARNLTCFHWNQAVLHPQSILSMGLKTKI